MRQRTHEKVYFTKNASQTKSVAKELASFLESRRARRGSRRAVFIGLEGELSAGKTTFAQGLARALGVKEKITSPSFVLIKVVRLPARRRFKRFAHVDCWRVSGSKEILKGGLQTLLRDSGALVVVEWADKVKRVLPSAAVWVKIEVAPNRKRKITIRPAAQ